MTFAAAAQRRQKDSPAAVSPQQRTGLVLQRSSFRAPGLSGMSLGSRSFLTAPSALSLAGSSSLAPVAGAGELFSPTHNRSTGPGYNFSQLRVHSEEAESRSISSSAGLRVQTKLKIGASDDAYEREADHVAERVMRMPLTGASGEEAEQAQGPFIQRKCTHCEEEEKRQPDALGIRRKCAACEQETRRSALPEALPEEELQVRKQSAGEDETDAQPFPGYVSSASASVQRSATSSAKGSATAGSTERSAGPAASSSFDSISEHALTSGGSPLPPSVLNFYERRFGRDFSGVRVHSGAQAESYNQTLHAHAFTYGHHVWMGAGKRVEPSLLLAHELAHVVQQRQPRMIPQRGSSATPGQSQTRESQTTVRAFRPYWEPYEMNGTKNHEMVLPVMGETNSGLFVEAPVPNADLLSAAYGKTGRADLYKASTTVGVYFTGHNAAAALKSTRGLLFNGKSFDHKGSAAPSLSATGALTGAAKAPAEVVVGDLKPSHGTIEALEGTGQLQNYLEGFKLAQKEVNDPGSHADGAWPPLATRIMDKAELAIPPQFTYPAFTGQASSRIVIKGFTGWAKDPKNQGNRVMGKLAVYPDPHNNGIWNYTWVPDTAPAAASLPAKVAGLLPEVDKDILTPLVTSPLVVKPKAKAGQPPPEAITHDAAPVVRRKDEVPAQDNFDFAAWKASHDKVSKEFDEQKGTQEFKDSEQQLQAGQAQQAIRDSGLAVPDVAGGKETAHSLGKIEFWTGLAALPFGYMRRIFGPAFVKVAQLFIKARDKFRDLLKKTAQKAGGGGLIGAALRAAFKVLKLAVSYVIGKVADRLLQSLTQGITDKLKSLISGEVQEELEAKALEVKKLQEDLEQKARDSVEGLLEKVVGPYLSKIEAIKDVYNLVSDIVRLVNLVKWGARVIACLSPPAWGCLWILAQSIIEQLAAKVVETCWFQKKIAPLLTGIKYIADLPNQLADLIIEKIRGFLPESVHDIFATLDKSAVTVGQGDLACEEEQPFTPNPQQEELLHLQEQLGEEKFAALGELIQQHGIKKDQPISAGELEKLGDMIVNSGVTAEQMRAAAQSAGGGIPVPLKSFLDDVKAGRVGGSTPVATPPPGQQQPPAQQPPQAGGAAQPGDAAGKPGEGGGLPVVDAKSHPWQPTGPTTIDKEFSGEVINPSWQHTAGSTAKIDILAFWNQEARFVIKDVSVQVTRRSWYPPNSTAKTAQYLVITYKVVTGVDLSVLKPNAGLAAGSSGGARLKNPGAP